jgi:hypothetical protein
LGIRNQLLAVSLIALVISNSGADDRSNARSTGMAFSSMVSSFGTNAYGINPANFDFHKVSRLKVKAANNQFVYKTKPLFPSWEVSVLSVGGGYGSDSSIGFYNDYLSYLSIDRQKFVNLFTDLTEVLKFRQNVLPGERTDVNYDFELRWFSVNLANPKYGAFNITMSDKVGLNTNVFSRDEALPLNFGVNYDPNTQKTDLTNVHLKQAEAIAWWIRKYNLGYAKQFDFKNSAVKSFSIGVSVGLVHGFGNVSTYESKLEIGTWGVKNTGGANHVDSIKGKQDFHTQFALTDFFRDYKDGAESHFNLFPKPAGTGYTFDFGIAMQIGTQWRIAASVIDLGKITWDYNTVTNDDTNSFAYYDFDLTPTDPTYNALVDDLGGYHTQDTGTTFKTDMPTKYHAGIMYQPSDKFMIEFNWVKGINNFPGNSDADVFALGAEYFVLPYLPVRMGASVGGPGDYYISLGGGVKFKNFTVDVGTHGINQLIADKRFSVAVTGRVMF